MTLTRLQVFIVFIIGIICLVLILAAAWVRDFKLDNTVGTVVGMGIGGLLATLRPSSTPPVEEKDSEKKDG